MGKFFIGEYTIMSDYYGYVYKITNKLNNKIYIGQKTSPVFVESYFDNGKRERVKDVYVLSYYPYKIIFRTRSGVYLYDCMGLNESLNTIEKFSGSYYFYFLGFDSNKPLKDYTLQNKVLEFHINKVQFTDKDLLI